MDMDYLKFLEEMDTYNEWTSEEDEKWFKDLEDEVASEVQHSHTFTVEGIPAQQDYYPHYPVQGALGLGFYKEAKDERSEKVQDDVNHPSHYTLGRQEVVITLEDAVKDAPDPVLGGLQWNVLKYQLRVWGKDNPLQDLKKSRWYLNRMIEKMESATSEE